MATNVLVYDGPGVSASALQHTLRTLRRLLPAYDVQTVNARTLALEPWHASTALVVLPGGRDLPYVDQLGLPHAHHELAHLGQRTANDQIARFVHAGGSFLGICAGAYYSSAKCVFEPNTPMQVIGDRTHFRFFPGDCVGTVYPGFVYESDAGARLIDLELETPLPGGIAAFQCQYNGGGAFIQADAYASQGVTVLARYSHDDPVLTAPQQPPTQKPSFAGQAAAVLCQVDKGKALLYGSHPEFPMSIMSMYFESAAAAAAATPSHREPVAVDQGTSAGASASASLVAALERAEALRLTVFGQHLSLLGLSVELPADTTRTRPAFVQGLSQPSTSSASASASAPAPPSEPSITDPPRLTPLLLATHDGPALWDRIQRSAGAGTGSKASSKHLDSIAALVSDGIIAAPALTIADGNDTFHVLAGEDVLLDTKSDSSSAASALAKALLDADYAPYVPETIGSDPSTVEADPDLHAVPKYILTLPPDAPAAHEAQQVRELAPHFDLYAYLAALRTARKRVQGLVQGVGTGADADSLLASINAGPMRWGGAGADVKLGEQVMYGQVVTSTQTMLDKNFKLLRALPTGFTSIATHQVSGRGRGKNAWISPLGCFQFSLVLRLPASAAPRIVFIQYLAGLAVALALREGVGLPSGATGDEAGERRVREVFGRRVGEKVRIKWPNDLYAEVGNDADDTVVEAEAASLEGRKGTFVQGGKRYAKLGGILVNSQFADKEFLLVVGCGVNVLNRRPTTSVSDLILAANARCAERKEPVLPILSQEEFGGGVLATFERLWSVFEQAGSFAPFVDAYKHIWLHSDQVAHLADADPPTPVRIVGISSDYGFLRAVHVTSNLNSGSAGAWGHQQQSKQQQQQQQQPRTPTSSPWIDLQPDGNSFDMLHNLIRRKD